MTYLPLAKRWRDIKARLATEGAENVLYDSDLNGILDEPAIAATIARDAEAQIDAIIWGLIG